MIATLEGPTRGLAPVSASPSPHGLRSESALDTKTIAAIRRKAALEGCKWDTQVGDVTTLAPFPIVMKRNVWERLAVLAEQLAAEAATAEEEISHRPELLDELGFPQALRRVLAGTASQTPSAGRVVRFDFHPTTDGWRISEANSDVPGGFSEASHFSGMMADHFPSRPPPGNPSQVWSDVLATEAGPGGVVALLSAPGYMEDHQVIAFLAARLRERGCRVHLAKPEQIRWRDGVAHLHTAWHRGPLNCMVRFYQAEWLARLPEQTGWQHFFRGGRTRVANPPLAVISESKRFPLVWEKLSTPLATWRALLPETRDPRDAPWPSDDGWLLKTALCNTGDTVSLRELMRPVDWLKTRLQALLSPDHWVAQRRFNSVALPTPFGRRHVCVGIYTVNGRAAGAYARLSEKPVIDFAAVDVALLLEDDE
jgi:glutathionylspermidine synthase